MSKKPLAMLLVDQQEKPDKEEGSSDMDGPTSAAMDFLEAAGIKPDKPEEAASALVDLVRICMAKKSGYSEPKE